LSFNNTYTIIAMKTKIFTTAILISLMCFTLAAYAQVQNLEIIGQTPGGGGYTVSWDETGEQLIVGCGTSIWVYDMSDPHNPVKIKQRPLLGMINETILVNDVLFVAATHDGLYALDYTSLNLDVIDQFSMKDMPNSAAYGMHFYNDTFYVADFSGVRMFTYDIVNGITDVGTFGPNKAFGVYRRGDYIAVCAQQVPLVSDGKVQVFHINNLTTPIGEWISPWINWVQDIQFADLRNDIIYVCGGPETGLFTKSNFFALQFDGTNLFPIDTFWVDNGVPGIAQQNIINMDSRNDTLFLATTAAWDINHLPFCHVAVLDATGLPNNKMVDIGKVSPGLWHFDVALMHGTPYAAISSEWLGVSINNVSQLAFMDTLGFIPTGGWVKKSKVKDNKLWVCNEGYGLMVYDIDSLKFANGFWCNASVMHIHDLSNHFFSSDIEFLNDTLILLNPSQVYNIKPWQMGGSPVWAYNMNKSLTNFKNIHTNVGQRLVATATDLIKTWIIIFDPFDAQNNYANFFVDTTNNDFTGFTVSRDTLYYGKKFSNNTWYLIAAKVSNNVVTKIDSIQMAMPWGLISFSDITGISVENDKIAVSYGKQIALFQWNGNNLQQIFHDYNFNRNNKDIVLRNNNVYIADQFYGMKVYDVSNNTSAALVAQTRGTNGWMNVFGSVALTLDNQGGIYLSDFCAGVILIKAYDTTTVSSPYNVLQTHNNILVYPNPFSTSATIAFENPANEAFALDVYNIQGALVSRQQNIRGNQVTVYRNDLSKGMYIFRLSKENKSYFGKFVVE